MTLRHVHLVAAVLWLMPGLIVGWWITDSMEPKYAAFAILAVSLYANAVTHFGAYGSARAEEAARDSG